MPVLVAIATVALILDGVDGQVARRTHTVTALGARFDMEVDCVLVLVLSVHVAPVLGLWVLAIGLMRYAWVAASWLLPWLAGPLPRRYSAKAVAVLQSVVLIVASSELIPPTSAVGLLSVALGLLVWSFGRSAIWLWQRRPGRRARPVTDVEPEAPLVRPGVRRLVITGLATALVLVVLIMPNQPNEVGRGMLHLPVEGVLVAAALLLLPGRVGRVLAVIAGGVLGISSVLTVLDIGFLAILARPFDPIADWVLADSVVDLLAGSLGRGGAVAALVGFAVLVTALLVAVILAVWRSSADLVRHRTGRLGSSPWSCRSAWCSLALGAQIFPGVPVASASAAGLAVERAQRLIAGSAAHREFVAACASDPLREAPTASLLAGLRGKDVISRSWRATAGTRSSTRATRQPWGPRWTTPTDASPPPGSAPAAGSSPHRCRVAPAGSPTPLSSRGSGSTTSGGTRPSPRASGAVSSAPFAGRAGRRSPSCRATPRTGPQADFYGFRRGASTTAASATAGRIWAGRVRRTSTASPCSSAPSTARPGRGPLFAEIALVSSHAPWPIIPEVIAWDRVGDGSVYHTMTTGEPRDSVWAKGNDAVRTAYRRSLEYSINSLVSWVATYGSEDTVVIVLGDHQPAPLLTGPGADRDVPITIISGDPAVLDTDRRLGLEPGIRPEPSAPVWRMDTFRDRFLGTFSG